MCFVNTLFIFRNVSSTPCLFSEMSYQHPVYFQRCLINTLFIFRDVLSTPCLSSEMSYQHPVCLQRCLINTLFIFRDVLSTPRSIFLGGGGREPREKNSLNLSSSRAQLANKLFSASETSCASLTNRKYLISTHRTSKTNRCLRGAPSRKGHSNNSCRGKDHREFF